MRIRVRGPSGQSTITVPDDGSVGDLTDAISKATSLTAFELKLGFPPKALDISIYAPSFPLRETGLKLNGEQITVAGREDDVQIASATPAPKQDTPSSKRPADAPLSLTRAPRSNTDEPPEIAIPSHEATIVLRVMPDDNSCMFRAVSSAILSGDLDAMHELRSAVAQVIQSNPSLYNEAILQKEPSAYCAWIQREDSWGGGIELGILAQHFDVEIASISVSDLRVDKFNEGRPKRIILVYSGIHYDTIALSPSDAPYTTATLPPEVDVKMFDTYDEEVLEKSRELCKVLQSRNYYTDTATFGIKCNVCGWRGTGEKDAVGHATETGHYDFGQASR